MKGLFRVVSKKSGETIKHYSYRSILDSEKEELRDNADIEMYCCCREDINIQQKIAKNLVIYNANNGMKLEHSEGCPKHSNYSGTSEYDTGWKEDDENGNKEYTVRVDVNLPTINTGRETPIDNDEPQIDRRAKGVHGEHGVTEGKTTILGLSTKINMITWKRIVEKDKKLPTNSQEFYKKIYGTLNQIKISGKKKTLQEIYNGKIDLSKMKPLKDYSYFYLIYTGYEEKEYEKGVTKFFLKGKDTFGKEKKFYADPNIFTDIWNNLKVKDGTIILTGFAYKATQKSSILTLSDFNLFAVNKLGLYSESGYEIEAYDFLCNKGRIFYKPYSSLPEYENMLPDIIVIDRDKAIIGEIFGMNTDEYLAKRKRKIQVANNISEIYDFWKWDAYLGQELLEP
jgi:hypothetical protein